MTKTKFTNAAIIISVLMLLVLPACAVAPIISGTTPNTGLNNTVPFTVSIAGSNFPSQSNTTVYLNQTGQTNRMATSFTRVSDLLILANFDLTAAHFGAWNVTVVNNSDSTIGIGIDNVTVTNNPPTLSGISPATGMNNSAVVPFTLSGTWFFQTPSINLTGGSNPNITATIITQSGTLITGTFNLTGAPAGLRNVELTNPDGQFASLPNGYNITVPPPVITSISTASPAYNNIVAPYGVGIHGSNFQPTASAIFTKSGQPSIPEITSVVSNSGQIDVILNILNIGVGLWNVTVTNPDGQNTTLPNALMVLYPNPPSVSTISPGTGINNGDQNVTITGNNFQPGATVILNKAPHSNISATVVNVNSLTSINATLPLNGAPVDTWNVIVTNNDTQSSNTNIQFTITNPPAPVASFTAVPLSGPVPLNVQFNDTSINNPTVWNWSFGDGNYFNTTDPGQRNTTHPYAAGTWSAKLTVSNAFGSNTSAVQIITVSPPPTANFTYTPDHGFAPLHVFFNDTSVTGISSRLWHFGVDEYTATTQNPDFTYYTPDTYIVNLTVTNASGTSSVEKSVIVKTKPVANFTGTPVSGPKPLLVQFTDFSTDATGWLWNFGDGTNSTLQNPNHTYTNEGVYNVSLIPSNAGGNGDILVKTGYITVLPQNPVASFNANPISGTTPLLVTFTDTSSNNPTSWFWNFGDGTNSTQQNTTHTFTTGIWNVTLTASNFAGGNTSAPTTIFVTAAPVPPVANFTFTSSNGFAPRHVFFSDTSVTGITSRLWRFGIDQYTATDPNPDFTYYNPGNYTVNLTVTNASGTSSVEKTIVVTTKPVANFTGSPTSGSKPLLVNFTDLSTNATGWYWEFGDGANSTQQNPAHTYVNEGTYTVTLTPLNAGGNGDPMVKTNYITVLPQIPVASFDANPTSGVSPLLVAFHDTSSNGPLTWFWNFGDGGNSTQQNPTHNFTAGTWNVTLNASNSAGGTTSAPVMIFVTPAPVPPVANFTGSPTAGFRPLHVQFTDSSVTNITSWFWTFGPDQYSAGAQNPDFTYNAVGNYTVSLKVTNASGNNTLVKTDYIIVTNKPVSNFTATPTSGVRPLLVNFTDLSTDATGWFWEFGDGTNSTEKNPGHVYANAGTYSVSLTAKNAGGSGDTLVKMDYITARVPGPVASFNATPTQGFVPLTVQFNDTSLFAPTAWNWDFGDFTSSTLQNPSHVYTAQGLYTVRLEVSNAGGTNTSVRPNLINATQPKPVADFTGFPASGTAKVTEFHFLDLSTNNPTSWHWNFGDGATSDTRNTTHIYNTSGNYFVTLTATNVGGSDNETKGPIVVKNARAIANFTGTPTLGSVPLAVQFTDTSSNIPNTWAWDFGDNTFARDIRNPLHTYNKAGTYTVTLAVNDTTAGQPASTLTRTAYITVTKTPFAEFTASPTNGTAPLFVRFTDQSQGSPIRFYWKFGDGTFSNQRNPTHYYTRPGVYTVTETVQNLAGFNTTVKENLITVTQLPQASFVVNATSGIAPTTIRFTDTSTGVPNSWNWDFGDQGTSTVKNPVHTYLSSGVYSVRLIVSNGIGSSTVTKTSLITIGTPTGADFTMKPVEGDVPLMIQFTDTSAGNPILIYKWQFGDGYVSKDKSPVHVYTKPGNYTVTLTITTNNGAISTVSKELVLTGTPVASFKANPTGGSTPLTVQFTDTSSNLPTTWFWTFGDGTFGNVRNPVHTYNAPGTYTVKLFVSNSYGDDTVTFPGLISVSQFP